MGYVRGRYKLRGCLGLIRTFSCHVISLTALGGTLKEAFFNIMYTKKVRISLRNTVYRSLIKFL